MTITYQSVGVDNAILIESITFEAYESKYVAGFNFDDKYFGGAESNEQMELTYNSGLKGTKFDILQEGASFEKAFDIYSIFGYKNLELNYKLSEGAVGEFAEVENILYSDLFTDMSLDLFFICGKDLGASASDYTESE